MKLVTTLLFCGIGLTALLGGMSLFSYGMRTANFSPAPPGNDNFVYSILALPIIFVGMGLMFWGAYKFIFRDSNSMHAPLNASRATGSCRKKCGSCAETTVECPKCGESVACQFAKLDEGVNCPSCQTTITYDDIDWGETRPSLEVLPSKPS